MKLGCADVAKAMGQAPYCNFVAVGKTKDELKQKLMSHTTTVHKDMVAKMPKQDLDASMKMMDSLLTKLK